LLQQVQVVSGADKRPIEMEPEEKQVWIEKYLEACALANAHQRVGNVSGDYYASAVELEDGTWGVGTNVETSPTDRSCGERISMLVAWNASIQKHTRQPDDAHLEASQGMRVKRFVMSQATLGKHLVPCSDCQGWMTNPRYFSPTTEIGTLQADPETGRYTLWIRALRDLMPMWGQHQPSLTQRPLEALPVKVSPLADQTYQALAQTGQVSDRIRTQLLKQAQSAYERNVTTDFTQRKVGAAALLSSGHIVSSNRFEWHKRTIEAADMRASGSGLELLKRRRALQAQWWKQTLGHLSPVLARSTEHAFQAVRQTMSKALPGMTQKLFPPEPKVLAVAYYGEVPEEIPSIRSLGYLAKLKHGGPDTLLMMIEGDTVQVRSIRDYMAEIYVSATDIAAAKRG
jgi:cytidine deaminase